MNAHLRGSHSCAHLLLLYSFLFLLSIVTPAVFGSTGLDINIYKMVQDPASGKGWTAEPFANYRLGVRGKGDPHTEPDFRLEHRKTTREHGQLSPRVPEKKHKLKLETVKSPTKKGSEHQCSLANKLGMVGFSQWQQTTVDRDFHITPMPGSLKYQLSVAGDISMVSDDFPEGVAPDSFIKALIGLTDEFGYRGRNNKDGELDKALSFYTAGWQSDFLDGILGIDCRWELKVVFAEFTLNQDFVQFIGFMATPPGAGQEPFLIMIEPETANPEDPEDNSYVEMKYHPKEQAYKPAGSDSESYQNIPLPLRV